MKNLTQLLFTLFCLCLPAMLQAQDKDDSKYLAGAVPEGDGKVVFTKEFSIPGMSQDEIYERLLGWMDARLKENENTSRVVFSDKEKGQIVGIGNEWIVFSSTALSLDRTKILYQLTVTCQPEKSVLEVEKIRFNYREGKEKYTAEEWIVDKYALNKAKTKLVRGLAKWRRKTVDFVDDLCLGAAEALSATTAKAPVEEKKEEKKEEKSTNKALKELVVENYELTPNFDPQTTKYSLTLKDTDEKLNIKATPEDEKATTDITGNGDFKVGNNIVKITVTAEDGTTRIYTITVSKTNENGVTDGLKLKKLEITNATLEPSFDPEITSYVIIVEDPSTIKTENVFVTAEDANVEVTVAENQQSENGEKVITIMLEDKNGSKTGVYQITVKKPTNTPATTLKNNTDNSIYFILGGIIGILLILIIIIIIVLKKTGNKENDEDAKNEDELSDNYDYSLKDAIDEANSEYNDEMVEQSNFKSQILNSDVQNKKDNEDDDITIFDKTQYQEDDDENIPDTSTKKKGKHF